MSELAQATYVLVLMVLGTDIMFHGPISKGLNRLDAWMNERWP